jgi:hypothetical protein
VGGLSKPHNQEQKYIFLGANPFVISAPLYLCQRNLNLRGCFEQPGDNRALSRNVGKKRDPVSGEPFNRGFSNVYHVQ